MTAAPPRVCPGGGWLVTGARPVPEDPSDWYDPQSGAVVGCNRLSCYSCGAPVRSARVHLDVDLDEDGRARLYDAPDWSQLDLVSDVPQTRLYACRCSTWQAWTDTMTQETDRDPLSEAEPPAWPCQGHPEPSLPMEVDGAPIRGEADLQPLADRVLAGWSSRTAPPEANFFPAVWAARIYRRLIPTALADRWAALISRGLASPDPRVKGLSLHFLGLNPDAPGFEALVVEAEGVDAAALTTAYRTWYGRTEDTTEADWQALEALMGPGYGMDASRFRPLLMRLRRATLPLDDLDARARELVRSAVLAQPDVLDPESLQDLASSDGEWLARHAARLLRGGDHTVYDVLTALRRANNEENLLIGAVALLQVGAKKRREVAQWLDDMPDADRPYRVVLEQALGR